MTTNSPSHLISESCQGERCPFCFAAATHKVAEEILHDDPYPNRHNLTAYVCCAHFRQLMGPVANCRDLDEEVEPLGHKAHCF